MACTREGCAYACTHAQPAAHSIVFRLTVPIRSPDSNFKIRICRNLREPIGILESSYLQSPIRSPDYTKKSTLKNSVANRDPGNHQTYGRSTVSLSTSGKSTVKLLDKFLSNNFTVDLPEVWQLSF